MTVETDPATVATTVVAMVREGRFADVEALFAPRLRAVVSAETLRVHWATEISRVGPVTAVGQPSREPGTEGLVRVTVAVTCEHGALTVVMSVDDRGMMHGLRLAPPTTTSWRPPGYAYPKRFVEHEVTVGSDALAVPGTLTLPCGRGRRPGVVLLSGGGPFDRDGTSGVNKPLKDLAWGLASRGVAVARFDKVTFAHHDVLSRPGFTIVARYLATLNPGPDTHTAVELITRQAAVVDGPAGRPPSPTDPTSQSTSTRPTTTCSSGARAHPHQRGTNRRNMSTRPWSPTSPTG